MYPRWLVTLDEDLEPLPVSVRVGQVSFFISYSSCVLSLTVQYVHRYEYVQIKIIRMLCFKHIIHRLKFKTVYFNLLIFNIFLITIKGLG